ncbi:MULTISPECIES: hypothetical protein [Pseudomonas]|uniref:hypothetical protein n=1 Tax=Pseudomonas TaxID=286 RepID=UPI0011B074F3|nr:MULTISPECIES: hypothetical protein [Pseudomonas]NMX32262.1 hypothetical protein [Pseudomonas sp. WS 5413]
MIVFEKELALVDAAVVERVFCVVDRCLRAQFPDDFYKRCLYASFGVHSLLRAMGHGPAVVGGNFLAFVVSRDQRQGSMQGYGSESGEHSHYWVELDGLILDLGTYYLPVGSRFSASEMPAMVWDKGYRMPKGLRYAPQAMYDSPQVVHLEPHIAEKMEPFLSACHARMAQPLVKPKLGKWLVTSPSSIKKAAIKGDVWARAVMRYESLPAEPLPF